LNLSDEKRIDILISQLNERYGALHKMRDRSMHFTLWILGLGLALAWLLISEVTLSGWQPFIVAFFLLVFGFCSVVFLRAIQRGFNKNRDIVIRIERLLSLYEKDFYGKVGSVLPEDFSSKKFHWAGHFPTLYILMVVVLIWLTVLTFINPCKHVRAPGFKPESGTELKELRTK
jgi:uncharacterized membrane protein